jgi:hypothetical protein
VDLPLRPALLLEGQPLGEDDYILSPADGCRFLSFDERYKPKTMAITLDNDVTASAITRKSATP